MRDPDPSQGTLDPVAEVLSLVARVLEQAQELALTLVAGAQELVHRIAVQEDGGRAHREAS